MKARQQIKKVDGFDYFIDRSGNVYNKWGQKLRHDLNIHGYPRVVLYAKGHRFRFLLHRLVAANWIGDVEGMDVHHKNGNKMDCAVDNLEIWGRYDHMAEYHGWEKIEDFVL